MLAAMLADIRQYDQYDSPPARFVSPPIHVHFQPAGHQRGSLVNWLSWSVGKGSGFPIKRERSKREQELYIHTNLPTISIESYINIDFIGISSIGRPPPTRLRFHHSPTAGSPGTKPFPSGLMIPARTMCSNLSLNSAAFTFPPSCTCIFFFVTGRPTSACFLRTQAAYLAMPFPRSVSGV